MRPEDEDRYASRDGEQETGEPDAARGAEEVAEAQGGEDAPDLETVMHLIWSRLDKLEKNQRRVKRAAVAVVGVAAVAIAVGAFAILKRPRAVGPSDSLALQDAAGNVRAKLETDPATGATILQMLDADGHPQAKLASDSSGSGLTFYDDEGDPRLRLGVVSGNPTLDLIDKQGVKQTRLDLASGQKTSRRLDGDEPVEPREPNRVVPVAVSPAEPLPAAADFTCWPGTLGCSSGYWSRRGHANSPG